MPGSAVLAPVELTEAQLVALSDAAEAAAATVRRAADANNVVALVIVLVVSTVLFVHLIR